jgi:bis(5'-adenosyl)-triphosphatase
MPPEQRFGRFTLPGDQVFYLSPSGLTVAIVNLRPLTPGHVLVLARRCVPRLEDLTADEFADLWVSVREVQGALRKEYGATGFNIGVQDGEGAGQSVPHVHVHILPKLAYIQPKL